MLLGMREGGMPMMQTIVVKNSIRRKFQDFWDRGRVLFLSAPCGFGKTTLAQTLLDGKRVLALTPDQPDFSLPPQSQDWEVLLLDDAQLMQEEEQWQALCTLIRTSPQRRFVVLSRGAPPGCLMAFRYAGLMTVLEPDDLLFGREDIRQLFQQEGVAVTDSEVSGILKESIGYPLGVAVTARNMAGGTPFGPDIVSQSFREVFLYFETAIYRRFDLHIRRFLLEMALFSRGGLYYELKEDYPHALECYTKGGDHSKVSELLIRNAELHPGMGHYREMEQYYRALPHSEILASPALMQGMSMLCALAVDYDGSEYWYDQLRQFAQSCPRQDAAGKQARSRLAWLDISLPQRSVDSLTETFPAVFRLMTNKEVALPPFSVTSTLPSIMNGGKDFSPWSKKDDLLYQTLRVPVEAVLGHDGVGLADCAIAESKFEKGEDISRRMLTLIPRMGDIRTRGTPDMEFAATALLARSQLFCGQGDEARRTVATLRERFVQRELDRFLPNMDAMLCRLDLHLGRLDEADGWYRDKAPRDPVHLDVMRRYQYLTQAMVELADGRPDAALMTLAPLRPYVQTCARHIDGIHLRVLCAIALFRKRDESWRQELTQALDTAAEFQFIRTVSVYGVAVLPLLEQLEWTGGARWHKRLMNQVRAQAACYPRFLQPRLSPDETLTAAELQVLRLMCADKSNAEIGQIMDVKLTTVKTHVSHILDKLGVSRRSEAKTAAKKLWLIPEDL